MEHGIGVTMTNMRVGFQVPCETSKNATTCETRSRDERKGGSRLTLAGLVMPLMPANINSS
eukprot:14663-Hanusia_phi.AAC.3